VEELQSLVNSDDVEVTEQQRIAMQIDLALMSGFRALQKCDTALASKHAEQAIQYCQAAGKSDVIPPRLLLASVYYIDGKLDEAEKLFTQLVEASFSSEYLISINGR
ncbi:MAG: hypothetical protein GXP19_06890, partial [Gammaproteobacteria bacterium]|nr:hypothetical protein [Gammaproteobacteria bacterium]